MSKGLNVVGGALFVVGAVWALQGVGVIGGSFMTGQRHWLVIGVLNAVVGLLVLLWGSLKSR